MGTISAPRKSPCPTKKVANEDIWFFTERDWSQGCWHGNNIVGVIYHGKAMNPIGSTLISLSGISLAGLLTFLWVMHRNIGYNNNSSATEVRIAFVNILHTREAHHILPPSFKVHVVGFRQQFELERPSICEINH